MFKTVGKSRKQLFAFLFVLIVLVTTYTYSLTYPPVHVSKSGNVSEGCISSDQAYSIAIPYIREYAQANNRLIIGIEISFYDSSPDFAGERGNASQRYPVWQVDAAFANELALQTSEFDFGHGVFGYSVLIWADTAHVTSNGPIACL